MLIYDIAFDIISLILNDCQSKCTLMMHVKGDDHFDYLCYTLSVISIQLNDFIMSQSSLIQKDVVSASAVVFNHTSFPISRQGHS